MIPPESIKGETVFIMDNLLDIHLGKVPGWISDRHPNLAGYHVIGAQRLCNAIAKNITIGKMDSYLIPLA